MCRDQIEQCNNAHSISVLENHPIGCNIGIVEVKVITNKVPHQPVALIGTVQTQGIELLKHQNGSFTKVRVPK